MVDRNYRFDEDSLLHVYEDELPEDMTAMDYDEWFELSWVDLVRIGPPPIRLTERTTSEP